MNVVLLSIDHYFCHDTQHLAQLFSEYRKMHPLYVDLDFPLTLMTINLNIALLMQYLCP